MPVLSYTPDKLPALLDFVESGSSWGEAGRDLGRKTFKQILGQPGLDPQNDCFLLEQAGSLQGYCLLHHEGPICRVVLEVKIAPSLEGTSSEHRWPSGHAQTFEDLEVDRFHTITEPAGLPPEAGLPGTGADEPVLAMFQPSQMFTEAKHRESPYDDYKRQPLLPNQYSQLGPGMAWGDIDGDGDDDLWVGGAKGHAGQLYRCDGDDKFTSRVFRPRIRDDELPHGDELSEDMAGVWLDTEGDGDLDLYVVSGGVECEPGAEVLRDRLYLNDGEGHFFMAPEDALPDVRDSGSVAAAADYDRDGDVDLFVGGRIIPGKYPLSPHSRLLRNDGGRFTDATAELAPALHETGLVTAAVWSDADADGWVDLLVTHEWGPVKLFHNHQGRLVDKTSEAGLANLLGWWNGIAAADVDNDGDMDYAVTNFGLNTKYHASPDKPTLLYYGDFEGQGRMRIVEAEFEDETLFPVRGKSCSTNAMPHLAGKFTTYTDFALADLAKIYTPECLGDAHRFEANTLESGVLINDGQGRFTFRPLPRLAQIAPGFGIVLTEVDGDGNVDLYMVQNFYGPQAETGRMAGGVSLLLRGRGDGTFVAVPPRESGLLFRRVYRCQSGFPEPGNRRHPVQTRCGTVPWLFRGRVRYGFLRDR